MEVMTRTPNTALEYRTRFKTSKRKLPIFYRNMFNAGEVIEFDLAHTYQNGHPTKWAESNGVIICLDEYAIVLETHPNTIEIIDQKSILSGRIKFDKELLKRLA